MLKLIQLLLVLTLIQFFWTSSWWAFAAWCGVICLIAGRAVFFMFQATFRA